MKNKEMIVFFKLITQGESLPTGTFMIEVKALAKRLGITIHDFNNEMMMPTTNIYHDDQTEKMLSNIRGITLNMDSMTIVDKV